ncbi:SMP-30/Gluconolactonase/LRE-like region, partial [Trinorchestia longiramus]
EALLYVDITAAVLHRYYTSTGRHQTLKVHPPSSGSRLSMAVQVEGHPDLLVVSVGRDIGLVEWKTSDPDSSETKLVIFASVDSDKKDNCLNDGKCDPQGRLWIGSMGKIIGRGQATPGQGALYRLSHDLEPTLVLPEV